MKICVYGAGAMGAHIGALLHRNGVDVTLIARGPHLAAMQQNGLKVIEENGEEFVVRPRVTSDPREAGPQDYVIIALKAHSVPGVVPALQPLLGPETAVITAQNGIPWWYFHKLQGPWEGTRLESVDPGGVQWDGIGAERAIGTVLWGACELVAPGVVKHQHGDRMPVGEPDGSRSPRVEALSKALIAAGFKSPVRPRIRDEIWMKLWGNLSFNPVSALVHGTLAWMARDKDCHAVLKPMMEEAKVVAEKLGVRFAMTIDARIKTAEDVGEHKTSMLQDLEAGRPMEIDALVTVVSELGRLVGVPTPTVDIVQHLVAARARVAGVYP